MTNTVPNEERAWEHVRVTSEWPMRSDNDLLAERGRDGWELCAVDHVSSFTHFYFKRPLPALMNLQEKNT